ncbi:hypothetical protein M427DRAFT_312751 [Gonapodya prolifera JEL478]|uniref:Helicase C-terminal domain-containing protein n=1 Tax=Gonapodya prolifera (strain JEL478) TaxID=1344416 RepID=A0A139AWT6_GONPJ|nr:hypothetical protein M427DRAFT_312751 [Gonapodya prolifera JEL478]|eukprot:KXS21164.1 hypothetical protein M427DRAFT_312751 [Gonapodya prolifera JEL478]
MLQRELCPQSVLNPLYVPLQDVTGAEFFVDPTVWEHARAVEAFVEPAAGVIAEDMGTGKTLTCISLIANTRRHLTTPPPGVAIYRTPYIPPPPWDPYEDPDTSPPELATLATLAAHALIASRIPHTAELEILPPTVSEVLRSHPPFYYRQRSDGLPERPRRGVLAAERKGTKVYLSSTTLVIVPDVLMAQWQSQLNLHTFEGSLRVLPISEDLDHELPPATELVKYDAVLISWRRLGKEEFVGGFDFGGVQLACSCEYVGSSREVLCRCEERYFRKRYTTPLLQVRWLRVIADEGHGLAQDNNTTSLTTKLNYERFWIVTGTPFPEEEAKNAAIAEKQDFSKLRILLTDYLKLQPFTSDMLAWQRYVVQPFQRREFGAMERLRGIMDRVMIRNREEDRVRDVALPPLINHGPVYLRLNRYLRMVHNMFVAGIIVNAVTSQREDEDYFFHPRNATYRRTVITNMRLSFMWWASFAKDLVPETLTNVREALENGGVTLKSKVKVEEQENPDLDDMGDERTSPTGKRKSDMYKPVFVKFSDEDIRLLEECEAVLTEIVHDHMFAYLNDTLQEGDVGYILQSEGALPSIPQFEFPKLDSRWPGISPDEVSGRMDWETEMGSAREADSSARIPLLRRPTEDTDGTPGQDNLYFMRALQDPYAVIRRTVSQGECLEGLRIAVRDALRASSQAPDESGALQSTAGEADDDAAAAPADADVSPEVLARRQMSASERENLLKLHNARPVIVASMSEKVTYLVDRIREHVAEGEKTIIYVQHANEVFHLHEAFRIAKIRCLLFHSQMKNAERASTVTTFNTSSLLSVIIMSIDIGAYGIDLCTASRIYFTSPVWSAARERQAIARARRIGQTRVVHVTTLVVKSSLEEEIMNRKEEIDGGNSSTSSSSKDNAVLNSIFENARFIESDENFEPLPRFESGLPLFAEGKVVTAENSDRALTSETGGRSSIDDTLDYYYHPTPQTLGNAASSGAGLAKTPKISKKRQSLLSPSKMRLSQNPRKSDKKRKSTHFESLERLEHPTSVDFQPWYEGNEVSLQEPPDSGSRVDGDAAPRKKVRFA